MSEGSSGIHVNMDGGMGLIFQTRQAVATFAHTNLAGLLEKRFGHCSHSVTKEYRDMTGLVSTDVIGMRDDRPFSEAWLNTMSKLTMLASPIIECKSRRFCLSCGHISEHRCESFERLDVAQD